MNIKKEAADSQHAIDKLRAENELKAKWLSLIAHDFKGLFTNIQFLLDAFESNSISQELFMSMLPELKQIAEKNAKTLESTFAWVNSQTDGINLHPEGVIIHSLFLDIKQEFNKEIKVKELTVKFAGDIDASLVTDKFLMKFILKQLVENAIKYSNKSGAIEVVTHSNLNKVNIIIKDNGVGMKDSRLNSIGTLDGSPYTGTMQEKGAGLSLVIVKDFVEILNGQMSISSVIDEGTSVALSFSPVKPLN